MPQAITKICFILLLSVILTFLPNWFGVLLVFLLPEIQKYLLRRIIPRAVIGNKGLIFSMVIAVALAVCFKIAISHYYYDKAMSEQKKGNSLRAGQYYRIVLRMLPSRSMKKNIYFRSGDIAKAMLYISRYDALNGAALPAGDFETIEDFLSWNILTDTSDLRSSAEERFNIDRRTYKSPATSLRIDIDYPYDKNYYSFHAQFAVERNTEYVFTIFTQIEMESGDMFWEIVDSKSWRNLCVRSRQLKNGAGWQESVIKLNSGDSDYLRVRLRHYGDGKSASPLKGTVWIDDWEIKKL